MWYPGTIGIGACLSILELSTLKFFFPIDLISLFDELVEVELGYGQVL
jgi:hypothetical protein